MADGILTARIDAVQFKHDINELMHRKFRGITTNRKLYNEIVDILVGYIKAYLPVDTGALRYQSAGESSKTHYFREGYLENNMSGGINWDAFEHRPNGSYVHYAEAVIGKMLGVSDEVDGAAIRDAMMANGDWNKFLKECTPLIAEAMRDA